MKWIIPLLALAALPAGPASAETTLGTAIASLPYTVTTGGVYHFTKNLTYSLASGDAIHIEATGVVLDLNGYQLVASYGPANTAAGIVCASGDNRVTITDGDIAGFQDGVVMSSTFSTVSRLVISNCLRSGISVTGEHTEISHNRICNIGGASSTSILYAVGISLTGTDCTISDNDVQNSYASDHSTHYADGIRLLGCANVVVSENRVLDVEPVAPVDATSTGISVDSTSPSSNVILMGDAAITAETGFDLSGGTSGKYGDNITGNVSTPYLTGSTGMTSIGNNN